MILLDMNLLARMTRSRDPQSGVARGAIQTLFGRGERLIVVPQNLYECWVVATRPVGTPPMGRNGLGMTTSQAAQWVRFFLRRFTFLPDHDQLSRLWLTLVEAHGVTGFRAHPHAARPARQDRSTSAKWFQPPRFLVLQFLI
jgi:hypothetical protein